METIVEKLTEIVENCPQVENLMYGVSPHNEIYMSPCTKDGIELVMFEYDIKDVNSLKELYDALRTFAIQFDSEKFEMDKDIIELIKDNCYESFKDASEDYYDLIVACEQIGEYLNEKADELEKELQCQENEAPEI